MSRQVQSTQTCHKLIMSTAKEMAGTFYDEAAKDNTFYKHYPSIKHFVSFEWGRFVPMARSTLASMLALNHISEFVKEEIAEALQLDRVLPENQQSEVAH